MESKLLKYVLKKCPTIIEDYLKAERSITYTDAIGDIAYSSSGYVKTLAKKDFPEEVKYQEYCWDDLEEGRGINIAENLIAHAIEEYLENK